MPLGMEPSESLALQIIRAASEQADTINRLSDELAAMTERCRMAENRAWDAARKYFTHPDMIFHIKSEDMYRASL